MQMSSELGALLAVSLLMVFVLWTLLKQFRPAQDLLRRLPWGSAAIDIVLFPAAVYGFGRLVEVIFNRMGLADWQGAVREVTELLITLALTSGIARLIELWLLSRGTQSTQGKRGAKLSQLVRTGLFGVCLFIGLIIFLALNDYAPTELYVSTGAIAALVAFAMQQTLGDLFSGIALSIEKPFQIGDWLRFSDEKEGEVTDINWRATRLRGWDNTTFVVPNGQLARQSFTNLHGPDHVFAPWYLVRVAGEADPQNVKKLLEQAAKSCEFALRDPAPIARLMDGASNPYTYMVWVHFPNYPTMFAGREQLYREIHRTLQSEGLKIATDIPEIRHRTLQEVSSAHTGGTT